MKKRTDKNLYDKLLVGAILMLAAEVFAPVPVLGPILGIIGIIL